MTDDVFAQNQAKANASPVAQWLDSLPKRDPDDRRRYTHNFIVVGVVDNDGNITWSVDEGDVENRFNSGPVYDDFTDEWMEYAQPVDGVDAIALANDARHLLKDLCEKVGMDTEALGWDLSDA
jgi:hypothetical protein